MSKVSAANGAGGGKVDRPVRIAPRLPGAAPHVHRTHETSEKHMTATSLTAARVRTGGPQDDGPKIVEHAMGWVLVVVFAMLVTQLGLL